MQAHEIVIGGTYQAKVSDRLVTVRVDKENQHGGWDATNLNTNKVVRIKTAGRLRAPVGQTRTAAKAKKAKQKEHRDQLNDQIQAEVHAALADIAEATPTNDDSAEQTLVPTMTDPSHVPVTSHEAEPVTVANDQAAPTPLTNVDTPKTTKLSAIDAAAKILAESDVPMTCKKLIAAMASQGLWSSPKGRTPENTLYSALNRDISVKKDESRFRKAAPGHFTSSKA